ncbi:MAG: hypothetical protein HN674_01845 [Candidatus Marinimicrobia bacterium]|nr:hypothetical protein [Candidatus Neomarinimicrobiota bacterium]
MMTVFFRRSIPLLCFFSLLYSDITGDLRVCALRVSFQVDEDASTTGNGEFLFESNGIDCGSYTIDSPPHDRSYFESQLTAINGYFKNVSYNNFGIDLAQSSVFPITENESYTLDNPMNYYNPYNEDEIQEERIVELFADAINKAFEIDEINFSMFDLVIVFHAGIGQDFSLPFLDPTPEDIPSTYIDSNMILAHLGSPNLTVGTHNIPHGIILPESQNHLLFDIAESMFSDATEPCEYQYGLTGTFALMTGFAVGLPPLWNIETGESGVGIFGLIDQGSNNGRGLVPAPPTAWTRVFAGWETPTIANFGPSINLPSRSENSLVKVPMNDFEYFLIENRNNTIHNGISLDSMRFAIWKNNGENNYPPYTEILQDSSGLEKDDNGVVVSVPNYDIGLPASGLLIWHINESIINDGLEDYSVNSNLSYLGVDLEESDGAQDIGYPSIHFFSDPSSGYFGDMWFKGNTQYELANPSMEGLSPEFGPFSFPSTKANNGSSTFITIGDISASSDTMAFTVSNSLLMTGFPLNDGIVVNSFKTGERTKILGLSDSLWITSVDTISNKLYFHHIKENIINFFIGFDEQENHTLIDVIENVKGADVVSLIYRYHSRYDYYHPTNTITKLFELDEIVDDNIFLMWTDSLLYMSDIEWNSHTKRVFATSFNYGIDLENSGISVTDFNGTLSKWENLSFKSISGIDLDYDSNIDVLALDSIGSLYAFNSELVLLAGFPMAIKLQSPVLSRNLFGDEYPEIVAKSADSSSIYIFDYQGKIKYQISSTKNDELVGLKSINGKNSILTHFLIYQFDDETDTNGNEWSFEHGGWSRNRTINLEYSFESEDENQHIRSYCYPNPIRENLGTIRVETIGAKKVEVKLYDLAGYHINTWSKDIYLSGKQIVEFPWNASKQESGVYFAYVEVTSDSGIESNVIKIAVIH